MHRKWNITAKRWIAWICMVTGWLVGGYGFIIVMRYFLQGHIHPLFFGEDAMSFSDACSHVLIGISIFWIGFLFREETFNRSYQSQSQGFTAAQKIQLLLALMSSLTLITTALIAAFK